MIAAKPEQTVEISGPLRGAKSSGSHSRPTLTLNLAFFPLRGTVFAGAGEVAQIPTFDLPHPEAHLPQPEKVAPYVYKSSAMGLGQYDYSSPAPKNHARGDMPSDEDRRKWSNDPFFGWNADRSHAPVEMQSGSQYTRSSRVAIGGSKDSHGRTMSPSSSLRDAAPRPMGGAGPRSTPLRGTGRGGGGSHGEWHSDPFSQFR